MTISGQGEPGLPLDQCTSIPDAELPAALVDIEDHLDTPVAVQGVYVHIPFCRHRCHYCDFFTVTGREDSFGPFADRMIEELAELGDRLRGNVSTIFVGGGTPTILPPDQLRRVMDAVRERLPLGKDCEWTVEANPETIDYARAQALAEAGVNRVSLGAQSFSPDRLAALQRQHDPESVPRSLDHFRSVGIDRLSLDLIFAIPGQTLAQWDEDLRTALGLGIQHLSAYSLVYEAGTPLTRRRDRGDVRPVANEVEADMFEHAIEMLSERGFDHYEVSNWAAPGQRCRHNLVYWRNEDWWAIGPGASGHVAGVRWKNLPQLAAYVEGSGLSPVAMVEQLDEDGRIGEAFMMGLRLLDGMEQSRVDSLLANGRRRGDRRAAIDRWLGSGHLEWFRGRLRFTPRGLLVADSINLDLL